MLARLVLDSSAALSLLLPDESAPPFDLFAAIAGGAAHVPAHWSIEAINGVLFAERRGRIPPSLRDSLIGQIAAWPLLRDLPPNGLQAARIVALAAQCGLTAYDAAYRELALRLGLPLATLDARLKTAAAAEGVPTLG